MDPLFEYLPVTAVAEVYYCERSFYYQMAFCRRKLSNVHVMEGALQEEAREQRTSNILAGRPVRYGVRVYSERLRLTGELDALVEEPDGWVPIEYKKGRRKESLTDRVLLCALAIGLEETLGTSIDYGFLFYMGTRTRIRVSLDAALRQETERAVTRAWEILTSEDPPPAVNDRRCLGCSFAETCAPDIVTRLVGKRRTPVLPKVNLGRVLYVDEPGAYLRKEGNVIAVERHGERQVQLPVEAVEQIVLVGNVNLSSAVVRLALERGIDILYLSSSGRYQGRFVSEEGRNNFLRLKHYERASSSAFRLAMARRFVEGKLSNMRVLLQRLRRANGFSDLTPAIDQIGQALPKLEGTATLNGLLGLEGEATNVYFWALASVFEADGFAFPRRTRRPPLDPVNALLSFCYSLLLKDVLAALYAAGLDPYLGFYHGLKYGRPALALDLMEEFRPLVADSVTLAVIRKKILCPKDFEEHLGVYSLTAAARKKLYRAYERRLDEVARHPALGISLSMRRIIEAQARILAKVIEGDLPEYRPFRSR